MYPVQQKKCAEMIAEEVKPYFIVDHAGFPAFVKA